MAKVRIVVNAEIWKSAKFYSRTDGGVVIEVPWIEASSFGRLRSYRPAGGLGTLSTPRIMEPKVYGNDRYMKIAVRVDGRMYQPLVQAIVLTTFKGPPPTERHEAAHFPDADTENNRISNLRWSLPEENCAHKHIHGTTAHGEKHGRAKMTEDQATDAILRYRHGERIASIHHDYPQVRYETLRATVQGKLWVRLHEALID